MTEIGRKGQALVVDNEKESVKVLECDRGDHARVVQNSDELDFYQVFLRVAMRSCR
jgi:hypothetical protein